jgi:hypothetical protein
VSPFHTEVFCNSMQICFLFDLFLCAFIIAKCRLARMFSRHSGNRLLLRSFCAFLLVAGSLSAETVRKLAMHYGHDDISPMKNQDGGFSMNQVHKTYCVALLIFIMTVNL